MISNFFKLRSIISAAVLLGFLAMPAHATEAPGAPSLPPFAPWMKLEESLKKKRPEPLKSGISPRQIRKDKSRPTPDMPVLTPEDTMAMIDEIYQENGGDSSTIENSYSERSGEELSQFGYDTFSRSFGKDDKEKTASPIPAGGVQDNFVVNIGDRLDVTFRGQRQDRKTYPVDNQGQLIVDDLPPVSAAGRTMAQVREALQAEAEKLYNTQVFVALESVRQVNILLIGHIDKPGRQTLTAFDTVLDALSAAGGVKKTGSLRQIRLIRDGHSNTIDLYDLMIQGSAIQDLALREGDRIIVPAIGPTLAVAGSVRRPGIYELLPDPGSKYGSQSINLDNALELAGGILNPGQNRFVHMRLTPDGRETVTPVNDDQKNVFRDGSILTVAASREKRTDVVELSGHVRQPGAHALSTAQTLSSLLDNERVLGPDIYPLIGVIERRDEKHLSPQMIDFLPLQVVRRKFDLRLQDGDVIHLFSRKQIMALQDGDAEAETLAMLNKALKEDAEPVEEETITDPVMTSFLHERNAFVRGAVRNEGAWPVADDATLADMIAVAGGLNLEASTADIEVTSRHQGEGPQSGGRSGVERITVNLKDTDPATVKIGPGDSVRVKQKFQRIANKSVMILGEVANPGRYDLMPGERMSELLARVGGLTEVAYPEGAIFSRESERKAEEQRFRGQAQDLELRLASSLNSASKKEDAPSDQKIEAVQSLIAQLKRAKGIGRITVEADPAVLAVQPELDILLEPGDRVYIPKRPLTVRVAGEVLSPANLQFRKTKSPTDYIDEAGGATYDADEDRAFVLYPDGSAQPLSGSFWSHSAALIPPGSTIVVPRDPKPFDFLTTARDVTQILSNLAVTAIFVDDIKDNND